MVVASYCAPLRSVSCNLPFLDMLEPLLLRGLLPYSTYRIILNNYEGAENNVGIGSVYCQSRWLFKSLRELR